MPNSVIGSPISMPEPCNWSCAPRLTMVAPDGEPRAALIDPGGPLPVATGLLLLAFTTPSLMFSVPLNWLAPLSDKAPAPALAIALPPPEMLLAMLAAPFVVLAAGATNTLASVGNVKLVTRIESPGPARATPPIELPDGMLPVNAPGPVRMAPPVMFNVTSLPLSTTAPLVFVAAVGSRWRIKPKIVFDVVS